MLNYKQNITSFHKIIFVILYFRLHKICLDNILEMLEVPEKITILLVLLLYLNLCNNCIFMYLFKSFLLSFFVILFFLILFFFNIINVIPDFYLNLCVKFEFIKKKLKYLWYIKILRIKTINEKILKNHKCDV